MNTYNYYFTEASSLIEFIEKNKKSIIGCTLKQFHTEFWPQYNRESISDRPVILEMEYLCVAIDYRVTSSISLLVGLKEDIKKDEEVASIINLRNRMEDYYNEEFGEGIEKGKIEDCKIADIQIEHFSTAFECNTDGDIRPNGGDYFSTIRICLDSGVKLCLRGAAAIIDGYVEIWCE